MIVRGQSALVTGGASGLGAATARALVARGARVGILDRNADAAASTANAVGARAFLCDVADPVSAARAIALAREAHGPARILVHCAGVGGGARIVGREGPMPLEAFEHTIRVNLVGTFNMMRLAAADMVPLGEMDDGERGVIVTTTSVAAFEGQVGQAAYAASKGGIASLTLPAARELAQFGVRVLSIAPGLFQTPLLGALPPEVQASLAAAIPFPKRLGLPDEFAQLVVHMVENLSLNGEVVRLDGALRLAPR
jgi:NAD(P)-dependent dehydrogenase (short-subunit alcohol dehydrogenase family)